jgi:hypothetical protein
MDNYSEYDDRTPDMPAQVILIAIVGVWGYLTCSAILQFTALTL